MPEIVEPAGAIVFQTRHAEFRRQAVLPAQGAIAQEHIAAKADRRRDRLIVDERAVVVDVVEDTVGAEADRRVCGHEPNVALFAGLHRRSETPYLEREASALGGVIAFKRRAFNLDAVELEVARPQQMNFAEWRALPVDDAICAFRARPMLAGEEINAQRHVSDLGLRRAFVMQQRTLHVRGPTLVGKIGAVRVEDIGVVVDPAAEPSEAEHQDAGQHAC